VTIRKTIAGPGADRVGPEPDRPLEVVVAGGGVAGLEAVMALRALAGERVALTLITAKREFVYRPLATAEPFDLGAARRLPLEKIAHDFDAELVTGELDWVAPAAELVFTGDGSEFPYDALVLATGARPRPAWEHALTFTGPADTDAIRALIGEVESGAVEKVAFVVPAGVTWPLPLYELALTCAARARDAGRRPELVLFTTETEPLALFGATASEELAGLLEEAGVDVMRCFADADVTADGAVTGGSLDKPMRFDRVVTVPRLVGTAPRGVPHDGRHFVPIDTHGVVYGIGKVYAAGDGTDFPVRQGAIASHQAAAVAEVIAKRAGAGGDPEPFRGVLRSQLLTGCESYFLRTDLSVRAVEQKGAPEVPAWWPATRIAGVHLAAYLDAQEGGTPGVCNGHVYLPGDPDDDRWGE
jgi:sulfide:quinone oxidoreductase